MSWLVSILLCIVAQHASPFDGGSVEPRGATSAIRLEDTARRVGPFPLGDRRFSVVLREKHVRGVTVPDPDWQTTLTAIEIEDETGAVHYRRSFDHRLVGVEFAECHSATVRPLEGAHGSGLLVTYGVFPSSPLGGRSFQVLGLFEGKLVPFSEPVLVEGDLVEGVSDEPGRRGDTLRFRVWTGSFFVEYPALVDWTRARLSPGRRCSKMASRGPRTVCRYRVQADRVAQDDDLTFVRLHASADEDGAPPRHVVVRPASAVELMESEGEVRWVEDGDGVSLVPGDDFWIRVRIDGREGWIHTAEDLLALGLPQAG